MFSIMENLTSFCHFFFWLLGPRLDVSCGEDYCTGWLLQRSFSTLYTSLVFGCSGPK